MGWYYTDGANKASMIKEIENSTRTCEILERAVRGNHLWHVLSPKSGDGEAFIVLYLLSSSKEGWGYKAIDESMGPYYHTCPTTWFGKYPTTNKTALAWRERCLSAASSKAAKSKAAKTVAPGDRLYRKCDGEVFRVVEPREGSKSEFVIEGENSGKRYRAKRTFIAEHRITHEQARALRAEHRKTKSEPTISDRFVNYVLSFYGPGGLCDMGATSEQVKAATLEYWRSGADYLVDDLDSVVREAVRDILIAQFGLVFPSPVCAA